MAAVKETPHSATAPKRSLASLQMRGVMWHQYAQQYVTGDDDLPAPTLALPTQVESGSSSDSSEDSDSGSSEHNLRLHDRYDQDYAALLQGTIVLRSKDDDENDMEPVLQIPSSSSTTSQPSAQSCQYFVRVPCRQSDMCIMPHIGPLAQHYQVCLEQVLVDGSHVDDDAQSDFALIVSGEAVDEFCLALQALVFVRGPPTVLAIVVSAESSESSSL